MAVKITYRGKSGKEALNNFKNQFKDMPKKINSLLPPSFYPTIANIVRSKFKENFIAREGWVKPFFTVKAGAKKNYMKRKGISVKMGSFGLKKVIHGTELFGRATDTLFNNINRKNATKVSTVTDIKGRTIHVKFKVGIDSTKWDGDRYNRLDYFSKRITPKGQNSSILVRLTNAQKKEISNYIRKNYKISTRKLLLGKTTI